MISSFEIFTACRLDATANPFVLMVPTKSEESSANLFCFVHFPLRHGLVLPFMARTRRFRQCLQMCQRTIIVHKTIFKGRGYSAWVEEFHLYCLPEAFSHLFRLSLVILWLESLLWPEQLLEVEL